MSSKTVKKLIGILLACAMVFALSACAADEGEEGKTQLSAMQEDTAVNADTTASVTTTVAETTTTAVTTTVPETTTAPAGASIRHIIDTLEGKKFYLAGTMEMQGGESIDAKMTCDGDDYKLEMNSNQMKISMLYLGGNPYIVNNSTNNYILFDEAAIDSLDTVLNSFSSYGVSFSSTDISEMKGMMSDFDQNMDFSQYINDGEYIEFTENVDGVEHFCTRYKTEYGSIYIYTLNDALEYIDVYDADGLRQMHMSVSAFIPQVLAPITLNGLTQSPSILHLFGLAQ